MKKLVQVSLVVQVLLIIGFVWFGWLSDQAMSKDGLGDIDEWAHWNTYAGYAFYGEVAVWMVSIGVAVIKQMLESRQVLVALILPPMLMILGWFSLWFL